NRQSNSHTIEVTDLSLHDALPTSDKTGINHVEGCDTSAISGLAYSESAVTITPAQLQAQGGDASDTCGISSIKYQDSKTGSCPIELKRTFMDTSHQLNTKAKSQNI